MFPQTKPTLLAIGAAGLDVRGAMLDVYHASTSREAFATLRLVCFDLVVVGLEDPRLEVWELMRRMLAAWPRQRWVLASPRVTIEDEVRARSLGALLVLGKIPDEVWFADFIASLRERTAGRGAIRVAPVKAHAAAIHAAAM